MKPDTPYNLFTDKRPPKPPTVNQNITQNSSVPGPAQNSTATKAGT